MHVGWGHLKKHSVLRKAMLIVKRKISLLPVFVSQVITLPNVSCSDITTSDGVGVCPWLVRAIPFPELARFHHARHSGRNQNPGNPVSGLIIQVQLEDCCTCVERVTAWLKLTHFSISPRDLDILVQLTQKITCSRKEIAHTVDPLLDPHS